MSSVTPALTTLTWKTAEAQINNGNLNAPNVKKILYRASIGEGAEQLVVYAIALIALTVISFYMVANLGDPLLVGVMSGLGALSALVVAFFIGGGIYKLYYINKIKNDDRAGNSYLAKLLAMDAHNATNAENARTLRSYLRVQV